MSTLDLEMLSGKTNGKEIIIPMDVASELEMFTKKILHVVTVLRLNFLEPGHKRCSKACNTVVTAMMFGLACYSLAYTTYITLNLTHSPMVMSSKLLLIAWAVQSIVSLAS
ncbi:unnamed protein product [Cylicocyclus nassatus]|uniref:Uncharacterized protein n=1 Tax=Cylicocyclus nassatus TaxID=53992 RepID=A0AA36MDE9_CYLNA|nr:unnamed protein product [Cylicocyclus nassatus]